MENEQRIYDEATLNKDLVEVIISLVDKPIKDMITYAIETRNVGGLKQLVEILKECQY